MLYAAPADRAAPAPRLDPGAFARVAARFLAGHALTFGERAQLVAEVQRVRVAELERGERVAPLASRAD